MVNDNKNGGDNMGLHAKLELADVAAEWPERFLPYMSNQDLIKMIDESSERIKAGQYVTYEESVRRVAPWRKD